MSAREIAEKLTEAQRATLDRADHAAGNWWIHFRSRSLPALHRMGLVDYPRPSARITPLGLEVRTILEKRDD